ncbi:MAG: histidine--tRNA ligase [Puniceicoccales bacterium]|jgi:histidyl-tRNA synthetase|nr:histidine--tRNA ligase [Puniceicoccales bacterium]
MVEILPGFREFYPENCFIRNFIFEKVRQMCHNFGFVEYDAPILESLELFTEKSGEEIVSQLFSFSDRGGRSVALRPEMTPAVARMIGSKINALKRPLKWFSIEENFRYERPQRGRLRSFYQFNIDIFDEPDATADGEIIALAIAILQSLGLCAVDFHVRLSDRQLWSILLQVLGVPENLNLEILSIIDKIEKETPEEIIRKLNALGTNGGLLREKIQTLMTLHTLDDLQIFFDQLSKSQNDSSGAIPARLQQMEILMTSLKHMGLQDFITVDFSIVRGLAYYTGFVFEFFERSGKSRALAGGGRYDQLIGKSGYPSTAAVGLAIGDVTLTNVLQEKNLLPSFDQKCDLFIIFDEISKPFVREDIHKLRLAGFSVTHTLKENFTLDRQFKQALQRAHWIASYREGKELVTLRDVSYGKDFSIPRQNLLTFLREKELERREKPTLPTVVK